MQPQRPQSALAQLQRLELEKRAAAAQATGAANAQPNRKRGPWGWVVATAAVFFGKLKLLLGGLKLLSLGKLLTTSSTMLLTIVVYAQFYGWRFAAGFVALILIHELGHGLAARLQGLKVGAPVFIPFFGAFIALKERPKTAYQDFFIGAGGPLAGSAGGLACVLVSPLLGAAWSGLFYAVGYFALWLNLFNLFPVWQLDGARMTAPLSAGAWRAGFAVLLLVTLYAGAGEARMQPVPLMLVVLVGFRMAQTFFAARAAASTPADAASALTRLNEADQRSRAVQEALVSPEQRAIAAGVYFGLATSLVYLTHVLAAGLPKP
jgi:Zn-dependent protease